LPALAEILADPSQPSMHLGLEETGRITTNTVPLKKAGEILFEIAFVLKTDPLNRERPFQFFRTFGGRLVIHTIAAIIAINVAILMEVKHANGSNDVG